MMSAARRFVVLSGCSGGGKSALAAELLARGHVVVEEPGRRIVREETQRGGRALPWVDMVAFLRRAIELSIADMDQATVQEGLVFFDRGLIDAASALQEITSEPVLRSLHGLYRYDRVVFMAPPWPQIYVSDRERRHGYEAAVAEYERLSSDLPALGYEMVELPKITIEARADFVLATLAETLRVEMLAHPLPRNSG